MATLNLPSFEIAEIEEPSTRKFIKMPDNKARDAAVKEIKAKIDKLDKSLEQIKKDIEVAVTPKADVAKRNELTTELKSIIRAQGDLKKKKQIVNEQIKATDAIMKRKIGEIQEKTAKHNFKTVKDIEDRIRKLEANIESGDMILVEEKRAIKEITTLNKVKKDFMGFDQIQKSIDTDKAKIAELKKSLGELSNKDIQARFEEITKSLDAITEKNKSVDTKRKALFDERSKLYKEKDALRDEMRSIYNAFDAKFKKFKADMDAERKRRVEEEKAYNLYLKKVELLDEVKEIAEQAKEPADASEISELKTLISKLDVSEEADESDAPVAEIALPEGAELIQKKQESFFMGTAKSKKNKKSKKKSKAPLDAALVGIFVQMGVPIPSSSEDIPKTLDALKEKLQALEASQEEKSAQAIEKAQAKIDKIVERISKLDIEIAEELEKENNKTAEKEDASEEVVEEAEEKEA